jgi:hypothetical protein
MEAFVHIGTEKTGTTTIQATLKANRPVLLDQGVAYLSSPGLYNHRQLAACCMRVDRSDDFFRDNGLLTLSRRDDFFIRFRKRLQSELVCLSRKAHTVVISSEHFHSRVTHTDEVETLRSLLIPFCERIRIIVYLRPQVETALSCYSTALKCGHTHQLENFVVNGCVPNNSYYDYHMLLTRWAQVFGRENIIPRIFAPEEFLHGDLLDDFFANIAPDLAGFLNVRVPAQNLSLDGFGQCLLRTVNRHLPQFVEGQGLDELNLAVTRLISKRAAGRGPGLDPKLLRAVQARFAAGNELVRREYFPGRPKLFRFDECAAPRPDPVLTPAQETLLGEVLGMFARAWIYKDYSGLRGRRQRRRGRRAPLG